MLVSYCKYLFHWCSVVMIFVWPAIGEEEFFSSIESMRVLRETESVLINALESYLVDHNKIFVLLNKQLKKIKERHSDNNRSVENPIEAFKLIRRLVLDWGKTEELASRVANFQMNSYIAELPSLADLQGSAAGLALAQHAYNLNINDLVKGHILGTRAHNQIAWDDCLIIGRELYLRKLFNQSELWLEFVTNIDKDKIQVVEYLALVKCKLGKESESQVLLEQLWSLDPEYEPLPELRSDYNNAVLGICKAVQQEFWKKWMDKYYYPLCRGESWLPASYKANLNCRYVNSHTSLYKLAPLKMEEIFLDPPIRVFHDVISDNEIQDLINRAVIMKQRATVLDPIKGSVVSTVRVSQHAWLDFQESDGKSQLHHRIEEITGLSQEFSEPLQVNNYGLGGEYQFHHDYFSEEHAATLEGGNRIATLMFYLTDVQLGGATVFTKLGLTVYPSKGSALFWYNLDNRCQADNRSEHAGCPVVIGSKWVANKWLSVASQLFHKPCLPETKPSK